MTDYTNHIDVWTTDTVKKQILYACMKSAVYILTAEGGNAPNHANRVNWAQTVINDPHEAAAKMSVAAITNGDIQAGNPTDAQVQYVVDVMIDPLNP